jgi:hypothetical protein
VVQYHAMSFCSSAVLGLCAERPWCDYAGVISFPKSVMELTVAHAVPLCHGRRSRPCKETKEHTTAVGQRAIPPIALLRSGTSVTRTGRTLRIRPPQPSFSKTRRAPSSRLMRVLTWDLPGVSTPIEDVSTGLDHGIGHFLLFEVDSAAQAPAPPMPKSPQTSSAASDRKSALLPSSRQAE